MTDEADGAGTEPGGAARGGGDAVTPAVHGAIVAPTGAHAPVLPEEVAAVAAAAQVVLPGGSPVEPEPPEPPRWRFSGRWWSKPVPLRRPRP